MTISVEVTRFEDLPHDCKWFNRGCVHCQDHARMRLHREAQARRSNDRELQAAVREWLRFDNEVEPPPADAGYEVMVAYETEKMAITERVAAALDPQADAVKEQR